MAKRKPLTGQLRDAILNADKTRYQISKETGVAEAGLSRFVRGLAGLSLDSIDRIGEYLDLEITARTPAPKRRGK